MSKCACNTDRDVLMTAIEGALWRHEKGSGRTKAEPSSSGNKITSSVQPLHPYVHPCNLIRCARSRGSLHV